MSPFEIQPASLLQTIFDTVGVAVVVIDDQGRLAFANRAALEIFAENRELSLMPFRDWCQGFRFQDSEGTEIFPDGSGVMRALSGEQIEPQDIRVIFRDGTSKWLHVSSHQFSTMGLKGVLLISTDETSEIEMRAVAAQVQRLENLGVLAKCLAHDFNNILDTISSSAYLALNVEGNPQVTRKQLEQISAASQNASKLVRRLMQFGRTVPLQMRPLQINKVISDVLELVHPLLRGGINLELQLQPGLPAVEADQGEMEQVLVNLIVNAIDAMPEGGTLTIATGSGAPEMEREIAFDKQLVSISVSDTGIGMTSDIQKHIFEPFFTTKPADKGTGLGLASVYGIVQQHGGRIKVQSSPGKGAEFRILLPAAQDASSIAVAS